MARVRIAFSLVVALVVQGCSSDKFVGSPGITLVPQGTMPEPNTTDLTTTPVAFAMGPGDRLAVSVYGIPEATGAITVDPSGQISVPIAGSMRAAGNTTAQLAQLIAQRLRANHVLNPIVSVNVVEIVSQSVTVSGEVRNPGIFPVSGHITLTGAIARAEGTTEFTNEKYVVVFRTANAQQYATLYNLRSIRTGQYADPQVFPNDTIVVGESRARRVFKDALSAGGLVTGPVVALIR